MGTQLSHDEMRAILAKGQNVILNGQVISHPAQLPTAVDLALGNEKSEEAAMDDLDAKMEVLQAEKAKIMAAQKARMEQEEADAKAAAEAEKEAAKEEKKVAATTNKEEKP